jgi:transcriptional regulator with XRE-family HTH domain
MEKMTPLSKDPGGIGGRMLESRLGKKISRGQLSEMSGVRQSAIYCMENGLRGFSLHDLNRARRALGLSLAYVMDGEEETE